MNKFILSLHFVVLTCFAFGQGVQKRLILFGDAGEINSNQELLLHKARDLAIADSTFVFFLGDNIYPNGMGLEGAEKEQGIRNLHAQFGLFREMGLPVYFLAGNHDWNVSRPGGLEKLEAQQHYLESLGDPNIKLIPKAGSLGPVEMGITDEVMVVAYDSEYWLYPYHSSDVDVERQKKLFIERLTEIFAANTDKTIILLSHHPMITYGEHSLSFGWKQHVFPLTRINKNLYIPLPILGSIYPLWRGQMHKSAEDLPSKAYQSLILAINEARGGHKNVLFASGHDHGLQFIDNGDMKQIVSGSGSKTSFILNNKDLKFKYQQQGFCIVDCMDDNSLLVTYYIMKNSQIDQAYQIRIDK